MKLIIGATGVLGSALCLALKENEIPFIACGRKLEKIKQKLGEDTQCQIADLNNTETYASALEKVDTVVFCVHGLLEKSSDIVDRIGVINLVDACKKHGIKNIILFSAYGNSPQHPLEFYRNKSAAELHLAKSGIPYTIIQCPAFMDLHIKSLIGDAILSKKPVIMMGSGKLNSNYVAVKDLVNFTLQLLKHEPYNTTLILGGKDNLNKQNIIELYGELLVVKPKVMSIPIPMLNFLATIIYPFHAGIARLIRMAAYLDKTDCSIPFQSWPLPVQITSIRDFVTQHISTQK